MHPMDKNYLRQTLLAVATMTLVFLSGGVASAQTAPPSPTPSYVARTDITDSGGRSYWEYYVNNQFQGFVRTAGPPVNGAYSYEQTGYSNTYYQNQTFYVTSYTTSWTTLAAAPEIGAGPAAGALILLVGGLLLITSRSNNAAPVRAT